ncbi:MAG: hypothetical protein JXQ73_26115, partial [Phycisphaerae bacterium]|nr:hypothetical protein [Phycisphaerae bacterium]
MNATTILLCVVLTPLSTRAATAPTNLAPNPTFETPDADNPAFWSQRTPSDDQRTLTWDEQVRRSGKHSLKIENRAAVESRWRTGHLRDLALEIGTQCQFTAWAQTEDVSGGAFLRLYFLRPDGGIVAQPMSNRLAGTTPWTQLRINAVVPQAAAYSMLYLELNGAGSAWFDDVELTGHPSGSLPKNRPPPETYSAGDFEPLDGFVRDRIANKTVLKLSPKAARGRAQAVFWGETARYDVCVTYVDAPAGPAEFRLLAGDRQVARWTTGPATPTSKPKDILRRRVIPAVDIQQRSRITIEAASAGGHRPAFHNVTFTPAGRFQGELLPASQLPLPPTLRVYVT